MDVLTLTFSLALPWLLGIAALLAVDWPRGEAPGVALALRVGFGYCIGALLLTLWMRAASVAGLAFGWMSIALPLTVVTALLFGYSARKRPALWSDTRRGAIAAFRVELPRWQRVVWFVLLGWLAIRFALLATEVALRPLYPWDAWVQWATKARVWYELGHIVPFVREDAWLAGAPGAWFDASPNYPATVPLLQVWTCVALGRWDDSAMNWPWFAILLSLTVAIYGALRSEGVGPLAALVGAYFVASLPLLDIHVALAGYADLPMGAVYTLAALATYRWCLRRDPRDALLALFLAIACPLIKTPGWVWALTLLPAVVVALLPRRGLRALGIASALAALILLFLARTNTVILGYQMHLDFAPAWWQLVKSYFLMGNWNLLWYGFIAILVIGARRILKPPLVPLTVIATTGMAFLLFVFAFTEAAAWLADLTTANRATIHIAPLLVALGMLTWQQLAPPVSEPAATSPSPPAAPAEPDAA
ncbi:MAG: hypothetical protein ABI537_09590 [Casimicrobiaceae bacterium]